MRLAIADPPYPPAFAERFDTASGAPRITTRSRARRWYGDLAAGAGNRKADVHPAAAEWDDPARHRALLEQLVDEFDGWAIATSPDGVSCYEPLPVPVRRLVWIKTRRLPTANRIASSYEVVLAYPPRGRRARANRGRLVQVPDVLTAAPPQIGFPGAKPAVWTRWVLDAMGYDPRVDEVSDLFPGSGAVAAVLAELSS